MKNVETTVSKDGLLTIKVDLTKEYGRSRSGKTIIIASTEGNHQVASGVCLVLNCYKYPEQ